MSVAGVYLKRTTMSLTNYRNQLILEEQELKSTWTSHIQVNFSASEMLGTVFRKKLSPPNIPRFSEFFIEYEKAFDRIQHDKLSNILQGLE